MAFVGVRVIVRRRGAGGRGCGRRNDKEPLARPCYNETEASDCPVEEVRAMRHSSLLWVATAMILPVVPVRAADAGAAERGAKALLTKCYAPPTMTRRAYEEIWKQ